jgi:uncharacterized protein DUF6220
VRRVFAGLAFLLMLSIVLQFYFAASGAFSSAPNDESFRPHLALGWVIFGLSVLLTVAAAVARAPGRLIGMSGVVVGLVVLQVLIALLADAFNQADDVTTTASQLVFGLHAVNGLAIAGLTGRIAQQARRLAGRAASADGTARTPAPARGSAQAAS